MRIYNELYRVLNRRHGSAINLTECTRRQFATPEPFVRVDVSELEMTADDVNAVESASLVLQIIIMGLDFVFE